MGKGKEKEEPKDEDAQDSERETSPSGYAREIQRPKSALHSGDFREGSPDLCQEPQSLHISASSRPVDLSPPTHWYDIERPLGTPDRKNDQTPLGSPTKTVRNRSRTSSLNSFSSSYVLKAPTSPLVHQANNPDLDFSPRTDGTIHGTCMNKADRRRTLPPGTFGPLRPSPSSPGRSLQREGTFPFRSHQSRKSITSPYTLQPASSPLNANRQRARGQTFSTDGAPSHHAMVGSYEESILRGRMSTHPSKPLNFTAQIGVLGRGNCKSNLKCPPHVTITFPAVFYSYSTSGARRSISDDTPSPYVGFIDIENSLSPENRSSKKSNKKRHTSPMRCPCPHIEPRGVSSEPSPSVQQERRSREKRSRRSHSPQSPPGGSYRIPQQGQIQIIIKNPNKTAVKLFLIPYDLEGMEPGSKTFIRQRSYSVGPIIEADEPPKEQLNTEDKPILRYLAHLSICCTSKSRFYLHSGVRVVFANRVPDGKERLRNEIQYPEPRYSPYKFVKNGNAGRKEASDLSLQGQASGLEHSMQLSPRPFLPLGRSEQYAGSPPLRPEIPRAVLFPSQSLSGQQTQAEGFAESIPSLPNVPGPGGLPFPPILTAGQSQPPLPLPNTETDEQMSEAHDTGTCDIGRRYSPIRRVPSVPSRGIKAGESLLAIKLRNLDVMKRELEQDQDRRFRSPDGR